MINHTFLVKERSEATNVANAYKKGYIKKRSTAVILLGRSPHITLFLSVLLVTR